MTTEITKSQDANCCPPHYDSGLINDFGGGDKEWWQNYIRSEIQQSNDYWSNEYIVLRDNLIKESEHYQLALQISLKELIAACQCGCEISLEDAINDAKNALTQIKTD